MTRLKYERLQRGLTQYALGVLARLCQPDVGLVETCRLVPTQDQLARLAAVLGIPADALLRPVEIVTPQDRPRDTAGRYVATREVSP